VGLRVRCYAPEAADARLAVATDISKNTGQLPRMNPSSSTPLGAGGEQEENRRPLGSQTHGIKGHEFGLELAPAEREQLLAFLRTL